MASRFAAVFALFAALALGACASAGGAADDDDDDPDAAVMIDRPDATPGAPDAEPGAPDAMPGAPDANVPPPTPDASMNGVSCESGAVCTSALNFGSVSGDTGADTQTLQGYQSAWYTGRVAENEHGIFGVSTSVEVKLTSPAAADFDVFLYVNVDSDVSQECSLTFGTKTTSGNTKKILADWGEGGGFSNGAEDGRNVSIEVRPISGTCSVGDVWQLQIVGNQ